MKVFFVGAGPGAPDLITIRGAELLKKANLVIYAGSLVPEGMLRYCSAEARLVNSAPLSLDAQEQLFIEAAEKDWIVVRLHSGDPSIYGAIAEQIRRLRALNIDYEIVPGVSSFTAAAASLGCQLTKPDVSQSIILTRLSGRASDVPSGESLADLASHGATLCIFLSGPHLAKIVEEIAPFYSPETPVALMQRVSWDEERRHVSTLANVLREVNPAAWAYTTLFIVGDVLDESTGVESSLYSRAYSHRFRRAD